MPTACRTLLIPFALLFTATFASAEAPVAKYIFPAGGRQGATVNVRVGGLDLHRECNFLLTGPGVRGTPVLKRTNTLWFEGPVLPLPDSQRQEDYPKDMLGRIEIAADASPGDRSWRLWTSQGATASLPFVVGTLPEIVEDEIEGDPIPVLVNLPVTINGRIFPIEDLDLWSFDARKGQSVTATVRAASLGSPLDARLEILDAHGKTLAENDDAQDADPAVRFTAPADGRYSVRIGDVSNKGGQAYVYRLTLTSGTVVDRVYPLGGRRGERVLVEVSGQGVPEKPIEIAVPGDAPETWAAPEFDGLLLDLDDLPEYRETEPNDEVEGLKPLDLPAIANGRIGKPGDVDLWAIRGVKGQAVEVELRAMRLGSPLAGTLTVMDASGKQLAKVEATATDPSLRFTPPTDGVYVVRVAELFRSRGGESFAYRLRIAPSAPDYRLRLPVDGLTLPRGGKVKLRVQAERVGGFDAPIALTLEGLPEGVKATNTTIAAKQTAVDVTLEAEAMAKVNGVLLTVRGEAPGSDRPLSRIATLPTRRGERESDTLLLGVGVPTPFKVVGDYDLRLAPRGQVHTRRYRIERNGFDGPLEVSMADKQARHLQGVTGPTITVPASVSEFEYPVLLPPWMETGRTSRTCVMAVGVVKDPDGTEHVVSFTSQAQNDQIIAVVEPGRLDVEVERGTLVVEPGKTASLTVKVLRGKGLVGSAKVELVLPAHFRGVSVEPLELPADRDVGSLTLRFTDQPGPFNKPVTIRATVMDQGQPVLAETRVELVQR